MLTDLAIKLFVFDWFKKLDTHACVSELTPMLSDKKLEIRLPEGTYTTIHEFKKWYDKVINTFFDEVHDLKVVDIKKTGKKAEVNIIVNWQTKIWNPPAANSVWMGFDCYQKWIVAEDPKTEKPVIRKYIVEKLVPMPGSPEL